MAKTKIQERCDCRKVAIYARKSKITESGKSIENQISKCRSYADLKFDAKDDDILVYRDEGLSGYYSDRPAYMQMLQDINENKIKAVICYKFDRISRRTLDLLNLVEQLKHKRIAFVSCTDEVDTGSRTGKIVMSLLASISEFERDIIAERIADNLYELAKEGRWLGGTTPTGFYSKKEYLILGGKKTTINYLEPIPEEQQIVKELFGQFLQHRSLSRVTQWTKEQKIITKNGKQHSNLSIKNIIKNPVYAVADEDTYDYFKAFGVPIYADKEDFDNKRGLMIYNKTEQTKELKDNSTAARPEYVKKRQSRDVEDWIISVGKHCGIVAGRDWVKAQDILQSNQNRYAQPNEQSRSLLSGLIVCPVCGAAMYTRKLSGRYTKEELPRYNYVCKTKFHNRKACSCKDINGNKLDEFVLQSICLMQEPYEDYFNYLYELRNTFYINYGNRENDIKLVEKRLADVKKEISAQTIHLRTASSTISNILLADIEKLSAEQGELVKKLEDKKTEPTSSAQSNFNLTEVRKVITSFSKLAEVLSYQEKMELIRLATDKIVVTANQKDEQEVHIYLKNAR